MPATGPTRAAVCTLLTALLALAVLPATGGPAAASSAQPGRATVRLVVGTLPGTAAAVTRAAERFAAAGDALGAAWAQEEAALLAAEQGDNQRASRALRVALDRYERLGVTSDSDRARRRAHSMGLRAGGPQTRRRPRSGWASVTPTETTVVDLVRQGLTNPQIAHRLFLSPRTVQTYVSHVLQDRLAVAG